MSSLILAIVILLLIMPVYVYGYIGPGTGLSAIGSVLALISVILLYAISFLWYPIKRLIRNRKAGSSESTNIDNLEDADQSSGLP
jgi:hypothetical protein